MRGKTCLITGANAGIGKETAVGLAAQGARILMVCRDVKRGETARSDIRGRVPGADLELLQADLSSIVAVRELVRDDVAAARHRPFVAGPSVDDVGGARGEDLDICSVIHRPERHQWELL